MIKVRVMYGGGKCALISESPLLLQTKQGSTALHGHWLLMLITLINVVFHTPYYSITYSYSILIIGDRCEKIREKKIFIF